MSASFAVNMTGLTVSEILVPAKSQMRYHGFCAEAQGGEVRIRLRDGSITGAPLLCLHLLEGETVDSPNNDGIYANSGAGIFFEHIEGGENLVGSVFVNVLGD